MDWVKERGRNIEWRRVEDGLSEGERKKGRQKDRQMKGGEKRRVREEREWEIDIIVWAR